MHNLPCCQITRGHSDTSSHVSISGGHTREKLREIKCTPSKKPGANATNLFKPGIQLEHCWTLRLPDMLEGLGGASGVGTDLVTPCDNTPADNGLWEPAGSSQRVLWSSCAQPCNREMEANNKEHQKRRRRTGLRCGGLYSIIYNVFIWSGSQDPFRAPQVQLWSETELQSCLEVSHRGAVKLSSWNRE